MNKINLNLQANQGAWLPRLRVKKKKKNRARTVGLEAINTKTRKCRLDGKIQEWVWEICRERQTGR